MHVRTLCRIRHVKYLSNTSLFFCVFRLWSRIRIILIDMTNCIFKLVLLLQYPL
uniref:Uncharacterized protein n=1 Tax=Anguilla anguilla TaxID=7936 RepID=A0A0E9RWY4_ANGAN